MSTQFTAPLAVVHLPDDGLWQTLTAFTYYFDCQPGAAQLWQRCASSVTVPAGTRTDFASIPRLLWPLIGQPAGRYAQAAVLHDHLYRTRAMPRSMCDRIFREAMEVLDVPWHQRWLMWAGVRIGGSAAYCED